jgi:hypothetical protein
MSQFPEPEPTTDAGTDEVVAEEEAAPPMNRAERRAAARGGPSQKIAGPSGGRAPAPPVRHRDYASRKRG